MTLEDRIAGLNSLIEKIDNLGNEEKEDLYFKASNSNPWFTHDNINLALEGIKIFLNKDILSQWIQNYNLPEKTSRIGIVMAGNIPLVGFHDFLCV